VIVFRSRSRSRPQTYKKLIRLHFTLSCFVLESQSSKVIENYLQVLVHVDFVFGFQVLILSHKAFAFVIKKSVLDKNNYLFVHVVFSRYP